MNKEELIEKTNKAIADLVIEREDLIKAYNYYNGVYNPDLFKYIEDTYGVGSPTSVEFIPLIKKHVDALLGEYLGVPIIPKVSCKDSETINNIFREKDLLISKEVALFLKSHLRNSIIQFINGKSITDTNIEQQLNKLVEDLDLNFISKYEIAAQNVIEYIMQSKATDIQTKLRTLILDLLITGYTYFRAKPSFSKTNVEIEVLSPLNTFIDRNFESPYVNKSYRAVIRKWLTSDLIINQYGNKLTKEEKDELKEEWNTGLSDSTYFVRTGECLPIPDLDVTGLQLGVEAIPLKSKFYRNYRLIPVYEVEWIEADKDCVMQRYRTVKIGLGTETYILFGKDEDVIRSKDNPTECSLTLNGIYFTNRGPNPYSLVLACASLQD